MASMAVGLGLSALTGLAGLFNKPKPIETKFNQTQTTDQWSRPEYDTNVRALRDSIINEYLSQIEDQGDYFSGYAKEGMGNLARSGAASTRAIENLLASRGIRGSAAGTALAMPMIQQRMAQGSFLNSIPQLQDERRRAILGQAGGFMSGLPVAQHMTGETNASGSSTQTGGYGQSNVGNFLGNFGTTLAGLYGMGALNSQPKAATPTGSNYIKPFNPGNYTLYPGGK